MAIFKKIALWSLGGVVVLTILLVAADFLLPYTVNTRALKNKLVGRAEQAVSGKVSAESLEIRLLPLPKAVFSGIEVTIPDRLSAAAAQMTVYPKILPLLIGRLKLDAVSLASLKAVIELPEPQKQTNAQSPSFLSNPTAILSMFPSDMRVILSDSRIELLRKGQHLVSFDQTDARVAEKHHQLSFDAQGGSDWADQFDLQFSIDKRSLDSQGEAKIKGAKTKAWEAVFNTLPNLPRATMDLELGVKSRGLKTFQLEYRAMTPKVAWDLGTGAVSAQDMSLQGTAFISAQILQADLSRLHLAQPQLNVSGSLIWSRENKNDAVPLRLNVQAHDTSISGLRRRVLQAAQGNAGVQKVFDVLRGGNLVSLTGNASGDSWGELLNLDRLQLSGKLSEGHIMVPGIDIDLKQVGGEWQISKGVLSAQQIAAQWGETHAQNGSLKIGLDQKPIPIDVDVMLNADLGQLPAILKRVTHDPRVLDELNRLTHVDGSAAGSLSLKGTAEHLAVHAKTSQFTVTASYGRLPFPLVVQGGQLTYTNSGIVFEGLSGRMQGSTLQGLRGTIVWQEKPHMALSLNAADIVLAQVYPLLSKGDVASGESGQIREVKGRLMFTDFQLSGPPGSPDHWQYKAAGALNNIVIDTNGLPGPIQIPGGSFALLPEALGLTKTRIRVLDTQIEGAATVTGYRSDQFGLTLTAKGIIAGQVEQWLNQRFQIPPGLQVQSPITVETVDLKWQKQGGLRLNGNFLLPGALRVSTLLISEPITSMCPN